MFKIKNSVIPSIIGIFLLIWANDAYFIFGYMGKYASLSSGLILVVFASFWTKLTIEDLRIFLLTLFFYVTYLIIAFLQNQETLTIQLIAFQGVCILLFLSGILLSKRSEKNINLSNKLILFILLLTLIGNYTFYKEQSAINYLNNSMRDLGDESLNPIGVAYTHSLLFLFLFWILFNNNNKFLKALNLIAILTTFLIILSTLSRGALIYLTLFFLLFFLKGTKITRHTIKIILKTIGIITIASLVFYIIIKDIPFMYEKTQVLENRFSILFSFFVSSGTDFSAHERQNFYMTFTNNWHTYLLGQYGYKPYPHNQFLEMFMRWGIFGIPLLIFSIRMLFKSFRLINRDQLIKQPILFLIISLFFFSYLQSLSSMSLDMNRMLWLGFGYIFAYRINKAKIQ